jgi:myo-inositol-1(or 4)-monophosphatase
MTEMAAKQHLHLVFGGELASHDEVVFRDIGKLGILGISPNNKETFEAWEEAVNHTVDNAQMRYFVMHHHRLLDPRSV